MPQFKKLLVPVDYSDFSRSALKYAVQLALRLQGEILLLHVVEAVLQPSPAYVPPLAGYDILAKDREEEARECMASLEPLMEAVPHRAIIRAGQPSAEILAAAEAEGVDLIVMATHGRTGLAHLLMGSTTDAVMRQATVPVLTLRAAVLAPPGVAASTA